LMTADFHQTICTSGIGGNVTDLTADQ